MRKHLDAPRLRLNLLEIFNEKPVEQERVHGRHAERPPPRHPAERKYPTLPKIQAEDYTAFFVLRRRKRRAGEKNP